MAPQPEYEFCLDGQTYDVEEDFTFEEQRAYRDLVRELAGDPELNHRFADAIDRLPAMVTIIKRRTDADYDVEKALSDYKLPDLLREKKARPTKARKR